MISSYDCSDPAQRSQGLSAAHQAVELKQCVVLPTDTVYGIGADAFSPQAVATLLASKGRGRAMPPPVLIPRIQTLDGLAVNVHPDARALAEAFWPGALTLICHAQPSLSWDLGDTMGTVALRVPDDDVALELLALTGPLAVSSANRTGRPAATTAAEAAAQLAESVAVYLDAGPRADDGIAGSTIVDATGEVLRIVRQGTLSLARLREVVPGLAGSEDAEVTPAPAGTDDEVVGPPAAGASAVDRSAPGPAADGSADGSAASAGT
ncbi:threonylcarbamoyl-AMP synthase [Arthrobacter echini]|uniref:L-threonylcarbamoyladenylate synthase n=1 Tax=Arthrobacter echini TaxID=1529066 RepID=A0A4S5E4H4_9MICC|nr:L-threonylcarbamoyladenylate synthase [Arthrobacter echini]THJ66303.1 threonylcarbamoyl-AMP synthase [Arthrobacter echini]